MNTSPESTLLAAIAAMPGRGERPAIVTLAAAGAATSQLSYAELHRRSTALAAVLRRQGPTGSCVGLVAANSSAWIQADLALLMARQVEVPVPLGFSAEQAAHLLAGCQALLVDAPGRRRLETWLQQQPGAAFADLPWLDIDALPHCTPDARETPAASTGGEPPGSLPPVEPGLAPGDWICKIIHTSGTTSRPKGVRIRAAALETVVRSLRSLTRDGDYARYLNLVPFSLLLEQITALYLPLLQGGCVLLAPEGQPPLGEAGASIEAKLALMAGAAPSAMTLTPAMVEALHARAASLGALSRDDRCRALFGRASPPLLAAGGAPVAATTLQALASLGIPVFVGYGLSENSSVACWNTRDAQRIGTVGRPLPHVQCRLSAHGELGIRSEAAFAGYAGTDPSSCDVDADGWLWTGDLATIDDDGFVRVVGRKKLVIITAHGRNVSPEFVEASYRQVEGVKEFVILGEQRETLSAFVLAHRGVDPQALAARLVEFGRTRLSDVERVDALVCLPESDELMARFFTVTGRPRRDAIEHYLLTLKTAPSSHGEPHAYPSR